MGYVAIKGGGHAIAGAELTLEALRAAEGAQGTPLALSAIEHQLRYLHGRVLSEGGLYHPELASLAIKQTQGDTLEAAFALRAYRSARVWLALCLPTPPPCALFGAFRRRSRTSPAGRCSGQPLITRCA